MKSAKGKATYTVETYRDRKREYRWRIRHRNGRIVATGGEGYKRKATMLRVLARMLAAIVVDGVAAFGDLK